MSAAPLGHFCWPELFTPDLAAAKAFYTALFGWSYTDVPSAAGNYTLAKVGEDQVAGAFQAPESMGPPRWNNYVQVASADESAERAKALGGTVIGGPFDVPDVGRMAILQDPGGAAIALWQSGKHSGATLWNAPGTLCWSELSTENLAAVKPFYEGLFGWRLDTKTGDGMVYTEIYVGEQPIGGVYAPQKPGIPSRWLPYFAVANCDASARIIVEKGGQVLAPPMDIPEVGRFAYVQDPGGAAFHIIALAPHP